MKIIKCDRCNKEEPENHAANTIITHLIFGKSYDLCSGCKDKIEKTLYRLPEALLNE